MPEQELPRVRADFNELDDDNLLHVLPRQADWPDSLVLGARVCLHDDEGSTMVGEVVERTERLAVIQVLPDTWHNPLASAPSAPTFVSGVVTMPDTTITVILWPHHGSFWWEPAVQSASSTAPTTAELATADR